MLEKDSEGSDSLEPERYDRSRLGTKVRRGLGLDVMATFKPENIVSSRITVSSGFPMRRDVSLIEKASARTDRWFLG